MGKKENCVAEHVITVIAAASPTWSVASHLPGSWDGQHADLLVFDDNGVPVLCVQSRPSRRWGYRFCPVRQPELDPYIPYTDRGYFEVDYATDPAKVASQLRHHVLTRYEEAVTAAREARKRADAVEAATAAVASTLRPIGEGVEVTAHSFGYNSRSIEVRLFLPIDRAVDIAETLAQGFHTN